jgi:steroid delta-isomerase-like uncharacterized protein
MEGEIFNRRNLDAVDQFIAPEYSLRTAAEGTSIGRGEVREAMSAYLNGFSNLHIDIEQLIAVDDRVVGVFIFTGTHDGEMFGMAPTGRRIAVRQIAMYRIAKGQVVEEWEVSDQLGLMQQLGALP